MFKGAGGAAAVQQLIETEEWISEGSDADQWEQVDPIKEDISMNAPLNPGKTFNIPAMIEPNSLNNRKKGNLS